MLLRSRSQGRLLSGAAISHQPNCLTTPNLFSVLAMHQIRALAEEVASTIHNVAEARAAYAAS